MKKLIIEDLNFTIQRIRDNESRYFQILIFCISSYGIVLGLSDKIINYIIPIILTLLLYISTTLGVGSRIRQAFSSAYLLKRYNKKESGIYHEYFYHYYQWKKKNQKKKNPFDKIKNIIGKLIYIEPFSLLLLFNIYSLFLFGWDYLVTNFYCKIIFFIGYLTIILLPTIVIIRKIILGYKFDYKYFINYYDEFVANELNQNDTTSKLN